MSLSGEQNQSLNVLDVIRGIWRRKAMLSTLTLLGLAAGTATVMLSKPTFQSEAQLIVENTATSFERASTDIQMASTNPIDERLITSQVTVLKSGDLYGRVVDQLKLPELAEFNPALRTRTTLKSIMIATGFSDDPSQYTPRENAIKTMGSKVTVSSIQDSNIITITSRMNDKKAAADVANELAEAYVASTRESDTDSTDRARQWLGTQISDLRQKVSDSENAVEKYRAEAGLLKGQSATLGTQQISELNSQITVAETASEEATARANEIRSLLNSGSVDSSSDVLNSPLIQNMREQQTAAARKVSELSATYLPNHPKMMAAQKEYASINSDIRKEALKVVSSLQGQAKIAKERASALKANLEKMKGREGDANISDVKLKSLERDAQANRSLLESMLARYADASSRHDSSQQPSKARIIQRAAVAPTPYFPKVGPTMFLTTLAGLALGLGLAFIMEVMSAAANAGRGQRLPARSHVAAAQLDHSFKIPTMLPEARLMTEPPPPLQMAPRAQAATPAEPAIAPVSIMAATGSRVAALDLLTSAENNLPETLRHNATELSNICQTMKDARSEKIFSFTSIGSEGPDAALASLIAARTLAEAKRRVVIMDVSAQGGDLEMLAGLPAGTGLTDLIGGTADFTKIITRDPQSTVHIIRKGLSNDAATTLRVGEKIESILTALHSIYDFVFVLAGDANPGTPAMIGHCPVAFILAGLNKQREAVSAAQVLEGQGVKATLFIQVDKGEDASLRRSA
jgi:polysaccharide biosynthesis transport protein